MAGAWAGGVVCNCGVYQDSHSGEKTGHRSKASAAPNYDEESQQNGSKESTQGLVMTFIICVQKQKSPEPAPSY